MVQELTMEFFNVIDEFWKSVGRSKTVNVFRPSYLFSCCTDFGMASELKHVLSRNRFEYIFCIAHSKAAYNIGSACFYNRTMSFCF